MLIYLRLRNKYFSLTLLRQLPQVILACLAAVAVAAPQLNPVPVIQVLTDERVDQGDGNFQYNFETENGIAMNAVGTPGDQGQSNMQGTYR